MKSSPTHTAFPIFTICLIWAMLGIGIGGYYSERSELDFKKIRVSTTENDANPDPLAPEERLEDLSEVCFSSPIALPCKESCGIFFKKEYSITRLPDCSCEVFTPPPKRST